MPKCSHLAALMRKNSLIMRRNCCSTFCEFVFPIILMILAVLVRKIFKIDEYEYSLYTDYQFFSSNSSAVVGNGKTFDKFTKREVLSICKTRPTIALVSKSFPQAIKEKIQGFIKTENPLITFKNFETPEELHDYVKGDYYGANTDNPLVCFGIHFDKISEKQYNASLLYFGSRQTNQIVDIPTTLVDNLDPFQNGPDMESYEKYIKSGYLTMMKLIYDQVLQDITNKTDAEINFGVLPQKFNLSRDDSFGRFIGFILPFFLVIAYLFPLSLQVYRMVSEKETRVKEGMKIMGLSESTYFLSYFIQHLIVNIIYGIINAAIGTQIFKNVKFVYLFAFFWLYGMNVFSLGFFFQGILDKTRLAMIVSILVYFIMYFVSVAVISDEVGNAPKMALSLLPPTALQLGVNVLAVFDSNGLTFDSKSVNVKYQNFSVGNMYLMLGVDILIYLFLGFYLQNILSHDFGIKKPFYFLCTKKFWCGSSEKKEKRKSVRSTSNTNIEMKTIKKNNDEEGDEYTTVQGKYFESEEIYLEKLKRDEVLKIRKLRKLFPDGKLAVNDVSLNLYKDEIFALLGHNGAGKSTMISMLSGLYEATSGEAIYNSTNILSDIGMDKFRAKLGICPQHDVLFDDLTVTEHLTMFSKFKGRKDYYEIQQEVETILSNFKMLDVSGVLAKNLSAGQRRKLSIMIALVGGSEVIFLDEPSSGMDITSRRNLWDILKQCTSGKIIVLTTHYMEEAAVLGKRIGIISEGNLRCVGSSLFLIEKFGKFVSVNITKEATANNEEIINFIKSLVQGEIEYEVLSEEIMFRLPKEVEGNELKIAEFFRSLDDNTKKLGIKSYDASMPTLEDVFLNVSRMNSTETKKNAIEEEKNNDAVLYNESNYIKLSDRSSSEKIRIDLEVSLKKRCYQIIRDTKSFLLEVLCPIILVVVGLAVSSVDFFKESPSFLLDEKAIVDLQSIYYAKSATVTSDLPLREVDGVSYEEISMGIESSAGLGDIAISMMNRMYDLNPASDFKKKMQEEDSSMNLVGYYFSKLDKSAHLYEFFEIVNTKSRQSVIVYAAVMMNNIIKEIDGDVEISLYNIPLPKTVKEKNDGRERNNATLVFFIAVAFALIPANFISLIIREREQNTKHLQIISGISLISYWGSNFIFELLKYYVTGGICVLIVWAFGFYENYFYVLYLLYGPAMVIFTYLFSFIFTNESSGQNIVILVNFLFGALGSTVCLVLRIMEDLTSIGKGLSYIFRIVPSFCFCYGYNELLTGVNLLYVDHPTTWMTMPGNTIIKLDYVGMDCLYLGIEAIIYLVILILLEMRQSGAICSKKKNQKRTGLQPTSTINSVSDLNDSQVMKEIDRANADDDEETGNLNYAVRVKKLIKKYTKGCCSSEGTTALKELSFCLEYGECFGFLGVNGAGKTTTFKCMTKEIIPDSGTVLINNKSVVENFNEIRSLIGYCPQFDAIFEYMTVYENLEFYARIKGVKETKKNEVITALLSEMNLIQYRNKISGQLSGGNKRKLSVSIAMICNPPIIFLDEPSTGMDPEARRFMWSVIHKISNGSKKSSVIMTTHSMDEAETLCSRIAILVNGRFKCMGSSNYIKEKYGDGYEMNLQITPLTQKEISDMYKRYDAREEELNEDDVNDFLVKIKKEHFLNEIKKGPDGLGWKIVKEIEGTGKISSTKLYSWCYYLRKVLRIIEKIKEHFHHVTISDYVDNTFVLKIKKCDEVEQKTIGFLFGFVEGIRKKAHISEYSIQQTSLDQIFNKFDKKKDDENNSPFQEADIEVDSICLDNLLLLSSNRGKPEEKAKLVQNTDEAKEK